MTLIRTAISRACMGFASLGLAGCVPPAPEPTPAPPQSPPLARATPQTQPSRVVLPASTQWMDAPQTSGDWSYGAVDGGSLARFGAGANPVFGVGCMAASRRVALLRYGAASSTDVPMAIRTETADRTLAAQPATDRRGVSGALPARDPILDAMAFSKGRFAVEVAGMPTLYLPSWPEVTRVIEDCR